MMSIVVMNMSFAIKRTRLVANRQAVYTAGRFGFSIWFGWRSRSVGRTDGREKRKGGSVSWREEENEKKKQRKFRQSISGKRARNTSYSKQDSKVGFARYRPRHDTWMIQSRFHPYVVLHFWHDNQQSTKLPRPTLLTIGTKVITFVRDIDASRLRWHRTWPNRSMLGRSFRFPVKAFIIEREPRPMKRKEGIVVVDIVVLFIQP